MGKKSESKLLNKIASISDDKISLIASLAVGALIITPAIMCPYAIYIKNVFRISGKYGLFVQALLPVISIVAFMLYLITLIKANKNDIALKKILCDNPLIIVFGLTALWMLISQIYNGMGYAFEGYDILDLYETFDMEIGYIIFILFIATQVKKERHKRVLLWMHLFVSILLMIVAFIIKDARVDVGDTYYIQHVEFESIFFNTNYYGYYLAVTVPLAASAFLYEKKVFWKAFAGLFFVADTVALSLNNTTGAWVGAAFAMLFIAIAHHIIEKKINLQAIILIIIFGISLYIPGHITGKFEENTSSLVSDIGKIVEGGEDVGSVGNDRGEKWASALKIINKHKLFGVGFEGAYFKSPEELGAIVTNARPHNEFLQYGMFYGIPAMILYFAGCLGVFIRALRKRKIMNGATLVCLSGAFGYLVSSFFGLTVFSTAMYLFIYMGMGYVRDPGDKCGEKAKVIDEKSLEPKETLN